MKLGKRQHPRKQRGQWYKLNSLWDQRAKKVLAVGQENVYLVGNLPLDMPPRELAVCLVPVSTSQSQGLALEKILTAAMRRPVLVLTNNIQLAKFVPVRAAEAKKEMAREFKGDIIQWGEAEAADKQPAEGGGVRGADREGFAGNFRFPGVVGPDQSSPHEGRGVNGGIEEAAAEEPREAK